MKKILFITAFPPNRMTAGQNYTRELLSSFVDNLEIDLIFFSYPNHTVDVNSKVNILKTFNVSKISKLVSWLQMPLVHPFFAFRFRLDMLLFLLKNAKNYNFIYFDFSQVFVYSLFLKHPHKILMSHDVIYQKMKRSKWFKLNPVNYLLYSTEKNILKTAETILTFSKKDQLLLKDLYGMNTNIVSFFIDKKIKNVKYIDKLFERKFCFFGAWNRPENLEGLLWFMDTVFPFIGIDIKFEIIGPGLDDTFLQKYKTIDRIKCLGFLEDPYKSIAESLALVAPIFQGAGVKVKVVESLATGTSILGTEIAFEGIDDLGDGSMVLCNNADDYIKAINEFSLDVINRKIKTKLLFDSSYSSVNLLDLLEVK